MVLIRGASFPNDQLHTPQLAVPNRPMTTGIQSVARRKGADREGSYLFNLIDSFTCLLAPHTKKIVLNCMPKAGSSYLFNIVETQTDYRKVYLADPRLHTSSMDINCLRIFQCCMQNSITRLHITKNDQNLHYLRLSRAKVVILVRDLIDILVSLYDDVWKDFEAGKKYSTIFNLDAGLFCGVEDKDLKRLAQLVYPWYSCFVRDWVIDRSDNDFLIVYDDLVNCPIGVVKAMNEHIGLARVADERVAGIIEMCSNDKELNNFNVGKIGRGSMLEAETREYCLRLLRDLGVPSSSPWLTNRA